MPSIRRAAAGALALGLVPPLLGVVGPARADGFAWPESVTAYTPWPECSTPEQDYCVESATLGGEDVAPGTPAEGGRGYTVSRLGDGFDSPNSFNWAITGAPGNPTWTLPAGDAGAAARLVIRVGALPVRYTAAYSDSISVSTAPTPGGSGTRTTVTISGSPTAVNWGLPESAPCFLDSCGTDESQAQMDGVVFSGNTQDMGSSGWDGDRERFTGMAIATNAQVSAPVVGFDPADPGDPESTDAWTFTVANPHLALAGSPATGSFTAQVPAAYFAAIERTAADTSFAATRTDGPTDTPVSTSTEAHPDGSATLRIDDLHYSSPRLSFAAVARPTAPSAVRAVTAAAGRQRATVTWQAPESDGGAPIRSYVLQQRQGTGAWATVTTGATSPRVVPGLAGGRSYQFRLLAVNDVGTGPWSAASAAVVPFAPPGGAGRPVVTTAPLRKVSASWAAAAANGAAVTYRLQTSPDGRTWTTRFAGAARSWSGRLAGTAKGQRIRFRVLATNRAGAGPSSLLTFATMR